MKTTECAKLRAAYHRELYQLNKAHEESVARLKANHHVEMVKATCRAYPIGTKVKWRAFGRIRVARVVEHCLDPSLVRVEMRNGRRLDVFIGSTDIAPA